jgi:cation diffusion facilitator CzcD-associated flavoprotein CzcO
MRCARQTNALHAQPQGGSVPVLQRSADVFAHQVRLKLVQQIVAAFRSITAALRTPSAKLIASLKGPAPWFIHRKYTLLRNGPVCKIKYRNAERTAMRCAR